MKIERGQWTLDGNAIWQFTPEEDITDQLAVQYGPDDRNFSVHFGNIGTSEYRITYKTKIRPSQQQPTNGGGKLMVNNMLLKFIKKMKQASV